MMTAHDAPRPGLFGRHLEDMTMTEYNWILREQMHRSLQAWLALNQRRQLRRLRLWDPEAGLAVAKRVVDQPQEAGRSARCLRPR